MKPEDVQKSQSDKFRDLAREVEADEGEDEEAFKKSLRQMREKLEGKKKPQ